MSVSIFQGVTDSTPKTEMRFTQLIDAIRTNEKIAKFTSEVRRLKASGDQEGFIQRKKNAYAFTCAGTFGTRNKEGLLTSSGVLILDFDHVGTGDQLAAVKNILSKDPHVVFIYVSIGGEGLKVGIRVTPSPDDAHHKESFAIISNYIQRKYGLKVDPSGKDICRLSFLAHDPEAYYNENAIEFVPEQNADPVPPFAEPARAVVGFSSRERNYAAAALQDEIRRVLGSTPNLNRNSSLNTAAFNLFRLSQLQPNLLNEEDVRKHLTEAGATIGLSEAEVRTTLESAYKAAIKKPREIPPPREDHHRNDGDSLPPVAWSEIQPLEGKSTDPFPLHIFTEKVKTYIQTIARHFCINADVPASMVLPVMAVVLGRRLGVYVPQSTITHVCVFWVAIVLSSGMKKTPIMKEIVRPLHELEEQASERFREERGRIRTRIEVLKKVIRDKHSSPAQIATAKGDLEELENRSADRYLVNDTSYEKLTTHLSRHKDGLISIQDELSSLFCSYQKAGRETDEANYLKLFEGCSRKAYHETVGRGTFQFSECLSIVGGIQPSKFEPLRKICQNNAGDNGFLPRFIVTCPDNHPEPEFHPIIHKEISAQWSQLITSLSRIQATGPAMEERDGIPCVPLTLEAFELFKKWLKNHEKGNREVAKKNPALGATRAKFTTYCLRTALLLQCLYEAERGGIAIMEVGIEALRGGIQFVQWLDSTAKKLYSPSFRMNESAEALLGLINAGEAVDGTTVREIYRNRHRHLTSAQEVQSAAIILEKHNIVKIERKGRSLMLRINPAVYELARGEEGEYDPPSIEVLPPSWEPADNRNIIANIPRVSDEDISG